MSSLRAKGGGAKAPLLRIELLATRKPVYYVWGLGGLVRYRRICICSKKILLEGSLWVYIFIYVSSRDYLERGVKTGICYPYTRVITCIRVTKIPLWPNLVVEYKVFLSWSPPILSDDSLSGLETSFWEWLALACQLRCKNEKILCIHPLKHFLCHFLLVWAYRAAYSYTWMTFRSPDLLK